MKHKPENLPLPALFTETTTADYLGVSPNILKLSRHTGYLFKGVDAPPHIRLGRSIRYSRETLDKWLSELPEFSSNADARAKGIAIRVIINNR